jgi:hypothetical protein
MKRYCSTGQNPQRAVAPMEEEVSIATECNLLEGITSISFPLSLSSNLDPLVNGFS